ncbi:helix-turn-helix transcriptional regulator, partial [Megamonas hypermegale]
SPMQYVIQQRIKEAQNLLLSTDLTITEIAFHCGYNNSNYFQSVFNNIVGMPPGKYRKSWKGI